MTQLRSGSATRWSARLAATLIALALCQNALAEALAQPAPSLSPTEVVQLQLKALKHNDQPRTDTGIATVFRFTSPGNRELTGPLPHFVQMLHAGYAAMIDFRSVTLEPVIVKGDAALQGVDLIDHDGAAHRYVFVLSRQQDAPYRGCWMTDSVLNQADETPSQAI